MTRIIIFSIKQRIDYNYLRYYGKVVEKKVGLEMERLKGSDYLPFKY